MTEAEQIAVREGQALPVPAVGSETAEDERHIEVETTTTVVLPANPARKGLSIVNDSSASIYVSLGNAAVLHRDIYLAPAGSWDGRISGRVWLGSVNAIAAVAKSNLCVVEV